MADPQALRSPSELVRRIVEQLETALAAARAADACVQAGNTDQALAMLAEVEPALYQATTLLNAASFLRSK